MSGEFKTLTKAGRDYSAVVKAAMEKLPPASTINEAVAVLDKIAPLKKKPVAIETGFDLADLMSRDFPEPSIICPPFIAEGLTIYAGKPKIGKTTLMRMLLLAANNGTQFLGGDCKRTETLFLSLEEGPMLARRKFSAMAKGNEVKGIRIEFSWHRGEVGIDALREYLKTNPKTKLVVIDSLSRFRAPANNKGQAFQQDYDAVSGLQSLCKEFSGLCIVVIHHTTKASFEDPLDSISGTYGISAACDSYGVILRKDDKYRLHWGGRLWDQDVCDFELERKDGGWHLIGAFDLDSQLLPPAQSEVLGILKREGVVSASGIATRTKASRQNAHEVLNRLIERGLVKKADGGYAACSST